MSNITVNISINYQGKKLSAKATKMRVSPHCLFAYDGGEDDIRILEIIKTGLEAYEGKLAFYGFGKFYDYFLKHFPSIRSKISYIVVDNLELHEEPWEGAFTAPDKLPPDVKTVFLCETLTAPRMSLKSKLPSHVDILDIENMLSRIDWRIIPQRAWKEEVDSIYSFDLPDIQFRSNQELILIDCPSRNMAFMPNGLAYVHNALKKTNIRFQTLDLDILLYHRFHIHRIFDLPDKMTLPSGKEIPENPWQAENYDFWQNPDIFNLFRADIDEIVAKLVLAKPKILGLSIQACNMHFSREIVKKVKELLPETIILVGGFSCYQETIGRLAFPESDYMVMGEADLTIGSLVEKLAAGELPKDTPGVFSKYDSSGIAYKQALWPQNLDTLDFPKYEWYNSLDVYRNHDHYLLTPIIASRGCRWSRCSFCAERFQWRIRSPKNVVDEFEWLADHGCDLFMFNESDLNGMPEALLGICDEIRRRKLKIRLTGQLRIHKKSDRKFFDKLHSAGFVALRFGVDAWAKNTLRLQMKGYTKEMIRQNLKDCRGSGINTDVNTVIGVPGETDGDVKETIDFLLECKPHIDKVANINPLMLMVGSVYWNDPENHNIHFRGDKEEIYKKYLHLIPDEFWFSEEPYIDGSVRKERFTRIVKELGIHGFDIGDFARKVIEDVQEGRGAEGSAIPDLKLGADEAVTEQNENSNGVMTIKKNRDSAGTKLIEYKGFVYRIGSDNEIGTILNGYNTFSMNEANTYLSMGHVVLNKCVLVIKKPQELKVIGQKIYRHLKVAGARSLFDVVVGKLGASRVAGEVTVIPVGDIKIVRDQLHEAQMILEGYNGYNIIKVGGDYYGIRQGYSFDYDLAINGGYPAKALAREKQVKDVKAVIDQYTSK